MEVKPKVTFVTPNKRVAELYPPKPSKVQLPDWWKKAPLDLIDENGGKFMSMKRCPGMLDLMTEGYIISLWTDVKITTHEPDTLSWDSPYSADGSEVLEFFHPRMSEGAPFMEGVHPWVMKFVHPWSIRTSPGVSCLYLPLPYDEDPRFTILPGLVETDVMPAVNTVCTWNVTEGSEILPAGTPLMQIIPFRRNQFRLEVEVCDDAEWKNLRTTGKNSSTAARLVPGGYRSEIRRLGYPRHTG